MRVCTVCSHADLAPIDTALVRGDSMRAIARQYGLERSAVARHKANHLSPALVKRHQRAEDRRVRGLLDRFERVTDILEDRLDQLVTDENNPPSVTQLTALTREFREALKNLGSLTGEFDDRPQVTSILVSDDWIRARDAILTALESFPEARFAVALALRDLASAPRQHVLEVRTETEE